MASTRLRILFLTPQLPYPPRQGTSIRNFSLIRYLAQNHSVDLISFLAPGDQLSDDNPLNEICGRISIVPQPERTQRERLVSTLFSAKPDMALRLSSSEMCSIVRQMELQTYDVIQVEGIEMAPYGLLVAESAAASPSPRLPLLVFDDHNCEYLLQKRNAISDMRHPARWPASAYSLIQWRKLRRYERQVCCSADLVVSVSDPDRAALQRLGVGRDILVAPNGIDSLAFSTANDEGMGRANIVFTGKMDYRPNIDAALWFGIEVFPYIQAEIPTSTFQIVGQCPHPRLDVLRRNTGIEITGAVPEIAPYLSKASVFVIPMRVGGGTRLKALEAMAAGLPIVTTSLGTEGIDVHNGCELLVADSPVAFAQAVLTLLRDQQEGGRTSRDLGLAARGFVTERYAWANIVPLLEQEYFNRLKA